MAPDATPDMATIHDVAFDALDVLAKCLHQMSYPSFHRAKGYSGIDMFGRSINAMRSFVRDHQAYEAYRKYVQSRGHMGASGDHVGEDG